jgi:hypothetical protein
MPHPLPHKPSLRLMADDEPDLAPLPDAASPLAMEAAAEILRIACEELPLGRPVLLAGVDRERFRRRVAGEYDRMIREAGLDRRTTLVTCGIVCAAAFVGLLVVVGLWMSGAR